MLLLVLLSMVAHADINAAKVITFLDSAQNGETELVRALLTGVPALVNASDDDGRTGLMLASKNGRADTVTLLLEKGADASAKSKDGEEALSLALAQGHRDIAATLWSHAGSAEAFIKSQTTTYRLRLELEEVTRKYRSAQKEIARLRKASAPAKTSPPIAAAVLDEVLPNDPPSQERTDEDVKPLVEWIEQAGGEVSKVSFSVQKGTTVATANIKRGETFIFVPHALLLNYRRAKSFLLLNMDTTNDIDVDLEGSQQSPQELELSITESEFRIEPKAENTTEPKKTTTTTTCRDRLLNFMDAHAHEQGGDFVQKRPIVIAMLLHR